tara:strand:+ start:3543 stop:4262 length:720 start_codon:yes stop_codon:yes gene_type:complete
MSDFSYSQPIDRAKITKENLQAMFDNIASRVTVDFEVEQFRDRCLRYKHFREPLRIFAETEKSGTALFSGSLDLALNDTWDWTLARLKHVQSIGYATNSTDPGHPPLYIHGQIVSHDWQVSSYEIGLGYSTNNGSAFTYWPYSNSFLGVTRAHTNPMWSAKTLHYHTNVAGSYWPGSMYGKREAHTVIAPITTSGLNIATITDWALGIRVNSGNSAKTGSKHVHELDTGSLRLISRDVN